MSSVTVNVAVPPGATLLARGVSDARTGCSAAPRTRTFAVSMTALYVAVSVTLLDCARPLSIAVAEVWPARIVTPPPTTVRLAGSPEVMATNVSAATAEESFTVSAVGYDATPSWATSMKLSAGENALSLA